MSGIVLSAASRSGLLAAQEIGSRIATTQFRLSSGMRTNSALDNPTRFFTASTLTARARDLTGLLDNISNGVQALRAAETTLGSISRLLDSAKATAHAALSEPVDVAVTVPPPPAPPVAPPAPPGPGTPAVLVGTSFNGQRDFRHGERVVFSLSDGINTTTIILHSFTIAGPNLKLDRDEVVAEINAQLAADPTPPP
jgi:flagellin